jgi:hypothetical protein
VLRHSLISSLAVDGVTPTGRQRPDSRTETPAREWTGLPACRVTGRIGDLLPGPAFK